MDFNVENLTEVVEYAKYVDKLSQVDFEKKKVIPLYPFTLKEMQRKQRYLANISKNIKIRVYLRRKEYTKLQREKYLKIYF